MLVVWLSVAGILLALGNATPTLPIFVARGYDALKGNPSTSSVDPGFRSEIFKFTYEKGKTTQDGKYIIPDQAEVYDRTSCSLDAVAK